MNTPSSGWWRFLDVLYVVALVIVNIATIEELVNGSAAEWSTWDRLVRAGLAALLLWFGGSLVRGLATRHRAATDRPPLDLARVHATLEREGRVAAVEEVRRQDPGLSLVEASRLVDASGDHDPRTS